MANNNNKHKNELSQHNIDSIDLVIVNLYPFIETIREEKTTLEKAIENIDIGGPTMIRAAAKNFLNVIPVIDPDDYQWIYESMKNSKSPKKSITVSQRKSLAVKAFEHISVYDATITNYLKETGAKLNVNVVFPSEVDELVLQILLLSEGGFNTERIGATPVMAVAVIV